MPNDLQPLAIPMAMPLAMPLGDISPGVDAPLPARTGAGDHLTRKQKAAIVVRLMIEGDAALSLEDLAEGLQVSLAQQIASMGLVEKDVVEDVAAEFCEVLSRVGLTFPEGLADALDLLDGHISPATISRLRRESGVAAKGDPWLRIAGLDNERLLHVLEDEGVEVGAVLLSKLDVARAAILLGELPGERARRLSYAISRTGRVAPETVRRIGLSLAQQLDAEPATAFDTRPVERVGAILNSSRAATRDEVLEWLDETDSEFAAEVRKAIFTFSNIPARIDPRDVPKVVRVIEPAVLLKALAYAVGPLEPSRDFLLNNMSKRMADSLREEIEEQGPISVDDGEEAITAVISSIRELIDASEILLLAEE